MAYIYKITNDINGKSYIGKTEFSIEKRFKKHCQDAFRERNEKRPLYSAMRKYGIEHFHIEQIEETNNPNEREIYWIEFYQTYSFGYNATKGGEGKLVIDRELVISTYQKLKNINETARKLNISPDSVSYILHENNIQIIPPQEVMVKKFGKEVDMFDLQGNYLKSFQSLGQAGNYMIENKLTNCKFSTIRYHIGEVCRGKRKTAGGFKWKYKNE